MIAGELLIPTIVDQLELKLVVAMGEGAGANVLGRFALAHPTRALGTYIY